MTKHMHSTSDPPNTFSFLPSECVTGLGPFTGQSFSSQGEAATTAAVLLTSSRAARSLKSYPCTTLEVGPPSAEGCSGARYKEFCFRVFFCFLQIVVLSLFPICLCVAVRTFPSQQVGYIVRYLQVTRCFLIAHPLPRLACFGRR